MIKATTIITCFVAALTSALFHTASASPSPFKANTNSLGCKVERVTEATYSQYQFQGISRGGEWLSYAWDNGEDEAGNPLRGSRMLNLVTREESSPTDVLNNSAAFSPDGQTIVSAQSTESMGAEIYEVILRTGEINFIASHKADDYLPSYSPDGRSILFNSSRTRQSQIYLYDRESSMLSQLNDYEGYDAHAEFSPDGRKILFHRMVSQDDTGRYNFDLYSIDTETEELNQLTSTPFEESYGSWSVDGKNIVFSSDFEESPEKHNLYILDLEGKIIGQITDGDWKDSYAYWTRDGAYIYFNSDRDGTTDIYRIKMNGAQCVKHG